MLTSSSYCLLERVKYIYIYILVGDLTRSYYLQPCKYILFSSNRYEDIVELLLKHGGRIDVEARMCWPGPHNQNCEERFKNCKKLNNETDTFKLLLIVTFSCLL